MTDLITSDNILALLTLTAMEVVLGIDNIVFISILTGRLEPALQSKARRIGLSLAMLMRVALLFAITWVMGLSETLFTVAGHAFSGRNLILLGGGLFLVAKATFEIHEKLEGPKDEHGGRRRRASLGSVIVQIMMLDIVFSLDSVITAVGMADSIEIMIAAVVIAVLAMLAYAGRVSAFIEKHPTMKMLALSFLLLIGVMLAAEGFGQHVDKGYIYFAMAFSLLVEILNMRFLKKHPPVHLRRTLLETADGEGV